MEHLPGDGGRGRLRRFAVEALLLGGGMTGGGRSSGGGRSGRGGEVSVAGIEKPVVVVIIVVDVVATARMGWLTARRLPLIALNSR